MPQQPSDFAQPPRSHANPFVVALLIALSSLLVACGSEGDKQAGGDPPRRTVSFPITHETHADIVAAVEACREGIDLAHWLSPANKAELYDSCNKGLKRGLTEVRQYGEQVCGEVAFTMPSGSAAEKKRVLDACEAKTKPFAPGVVSGSR